MAVFTEETNYSGSPWGPLQEPILEGIEGMQGNYAAGPWAGPYTAGIDPNQTAGINAGVAGAGGAGAVGGAYTNTGLNLMGGLGTAFDYFNQNVDGSTNPWLTNGQQYMDFAGSIANSPYLDSQITSALRDPYRNLTENQLPGNAMNAAMMGQSGGSGRQVGDAVARRGYADRAADVGAQMRGSAYNTGLQFANQAATGDQFAAQQSALQLANLGGQGLGMLGTGYDYDQTGAQDQYDWGTQQQNLNNQQLDAQMREFYEPWTLTENYGNYLNPLTENLHNSTSEQDLLPQFLMENAESIAGLGGEAGGWVVDQIQDWFADI